jgi:hypothetical protein
MAHRGAIETTEELYLVTQDMLIGQARQLEEFHWFVRAHLEAPDGSLTTGDAPHREGRRQARHQQALAAARAPSIQRRDGITEQTGMGPCSTPPNHTGWCARFQISRGLRFCFLGTSRFALRCSTDDVAFAHAARTARR